MVKKNRQTKGTGFRPTPIADSLNGWLRKAARRKIVDLSSWRSGREEATRIMEAAVPSDRLVDESPELAIYSQVTNWLTQMLEVAQDQRQLRRFADAIASAEEEYMPSGPPTSPLTSSYFWHWALYDMAMGYGGETVASVFLSLGRVFGYSEEFLQTLEKLVDSRMGLHAVEAVDGERTTLCELVTSERAVVICQSGWVGSVGELWLARVLPSPLSPRERSVVVTTPYVILNPGTKEWLAYIERAVRSEVGGDLSAHYRRLMKRGKDLRHWNEYIFEAYVNHREEAVFLAGLPDVEESRPHSKFNENRRDAMGRGESLL